MELGLDPRRDLSVPVDYKACFVVRHFDLALLRQAGFIRPATQPQSDRAPSLLCTKRERVGKNSFDGTP
jgi:hypothetical protein